MEHSICKVCKKLPVVIKKYQMCLRCYQKERKNGTMGNATKEIVSRPTENKEGWVREMEFVKCFFVHSNWVHRPGIFRMNGTSYAPDFYDGERNIFIEVAGTRQAYSLNKEKYLMMEKYFPKIGFEVRQHTGSLIDLNSEVHWER